VTRADLLRFDGEDAAVAVTCSAGFYVRSFAHDLGQRLGTGACLAALRRTRSGQFTLDDAVSIDELQSGNAMGRVRPLESLLPSLPSIRVTGEGRERVGHGRELEAGHYDRPAVDAAWVRLLDSEGRLIALAQPGTRPGSLHPAVVLI
jgi:tRNA pseudouridine55 synthase